MTLLLVLSNDLLVSCTYAIALKTEKHLWMYVAGFVAGVFLAGNMCTQV